MRGWLHTYAFYIAIPAGVVLIALAATIGGGVVPAISCAIYSLTVCGLFGTSALYHRRVWSPRGCTIVRRLDHSMIFVFIAGTYTPFSALLLPHTTAIVILSVVWGGAVLGVGMSLITPDAPRWVAAPLYVALGWVALFVLPDIARHGGLTALALLLAGGVLYTGARLASQCNGQTRGQKRSHITSSSTPSPSSPPFASTPRSTSCSFDRGPGLRWATIHDALRDVLGVYESRLKGDRSIARYSTIPIRGESPTSGKQAVAQAPPHRQHDHLARSQIL
jgi:hemolysin III